MITKSFSIIFDFIPKYSRTTNLEVLMKILDSKDLGKRIRERRKELQYTQVYLSEFTGFSVSFISDVENGKPTVEFEKTLRLMHVLGLDLLVEVRG